MHVYPHIQACSHTQKEKKKKQRPSSDAIARLSLTFHPDCYLGHPVLPQTTAEFLSQLLPMRGVIDFLCNTIKFPGVLILSSLFRFLILKTNKDHILFLFFFLYPFCRSCRRRRKSTYQFINKPNIIAHRKWVTELWRRNKEGFLWRFWNNSNNWWSCQIL